MSDHKTVLLALGVLVGASGDGSAADGGPSAGLLTNGSFEKPIALRNAGALRASGFELGPTKQLASGRIVLLWNRPCPEGETEYPVQGGDGIWSATPASNFREEVSIGFSGDECESGSPPVVVARHPGGECSYPHVSEPTPGVLCITAHRWDVKLSLREEDFAR